MEEVKDNQEILVILEKFCYKIKTGITNIVFTYFVSDPSQSIHKNKIPIYLDFDSINLQVCGRKIHRERNNYWNLTISQLNLLDEYLNTHKNTLEEFRLEIENFLSISNEEQAEKFLQKENSEKQKEKDFISNILKNEIKEAKALIIINDNRNFPYKSDKVKELLAIPCNVDEIFYLLNHWEHLTVTRSYVDKFNKERMELIYQGKIRV